MARRIKEKAEKIQETKDMRPHANVRHIRISPYKVRSVIDVVRGKSVNEALALLDAIPNASAVVVSKLIQSATANAEHNHGLSRIDLVVAEIFADGGPHLKRFNAGAKGRANPILKRTSHITVKLDTVKEGK